MKRVQKGLSLVLALALCGSLLAGCGGQTTAPAQDGDTAGEPAAEAGEADAAQSGGETAAGLAALIAASEAPTAVSLTYDLSGVGTAGGGQVEFEEYVYYTEAPDSDDCSLSQVNSVSFDADDTSAFQSSNADSYYVGGAYYGTNADYDLVRSETPTVEPLAAAPGTKLLAAAAACEPTTAANEYDTLVETYAFSLEGEALKEVVEDACPGLLDGLDSAADWSAVTGDWTVEVSEHGSLNSAVLDSPSLGALFLAGADQANCSELTLGVSFAYDNEFFYPPEDLSSAADGEAAAVKTIPELLGAALGESAADAVTDAMQQEMEEFEEVEVEGEGSVTLYYGDVQVEFSLPTEVPDYDKISQIQPNMAILSHVAYAESPTKKGDTGRTRVFLEAGTPEEIHSAYFGSLGDSEPEEATIGGYEGLRAFGESEYEFSEHTTANKNYFFATDVGGGMTLCVIVESSYTVGEESSNMNEGILEVLLNHCTVL